MLGSGSPVVSRRASSAPMAARCEVASRLTANIAPGSILMINREKDLVKSVYSVRRRKRRTENGDNCSAERAPKSHDSHDSLTSPKSSRWSAARTFICEQVCALATGCLLPSVRQTILTAGPWVSRPWFEQFLRAVTPLRDQRFHRCSEDHAIG